MAGTLDASYFKGQGLRQGIEREFIAESGEGMETAVRRLTVKECERLQGFPDDWTLIGDPVQEEVIDYEYTYDEDGNETSKKRIGAHLETVYKYIDKAGKPRKCTDSARYKALGNSLCLPFWEWMARRICAQYERPATVGSLFDGIGGFPLAFAKSGGVPVWASEIEEFCVLVSKKHFGDDGETGDYWKYLMNVPEEV